MSEEADPKAKRETPQYNINIYCGMHVRSDRFGTASFIMRILC
jgi:hypothetical protein